MGGTRRETVATRLRDCGSARRSARRRHQDRDRGLTLVEILISMTISLVLGAVLVAAIVTSLNVAGATSNTLKTAVDVRLISSYLARDAQGAAGTDPRTATNEERALVSVAPNDWGDCAQSGSLVARFAWVDHVTVSLQRNVTVTWGLDGSVLTRKYCEDGVAKPLLVLGSTIVAASADCEPTADCSGSPVSIRLTVTGRSEKSTYTTSLSASLRPRGQDFPTDQKASTVSLLALGDSTATSPCTNVSLATARAVVIGDAVIANECGASALTPDPADITHPSDGMTSLTANLLDPLSSLPVPTNTCGGGSNPALGTPGTYPDKLTITATDGPVVLAPGDYVFCKGLEIASGAAVTSSGGVFLYIKTGTLTIDPAASVELTATSSGDQRNVLVWVATKQTVSIGTGDHITRLGGTVYAPLSSVVFRGSSTAAAINVGALVAATVSVSTTGSAPTRQLAPSSTVPILRFGPIPTLAITPTELVSAVIGEPYSAALSLTGDGVSQLVNPRWSATGLDPFVINPITGEITGTPECALSLTPHVRMVDSTGLAVSADYSLDILSDLTLANPGPYVRGTKTLTATLGDTCGSAGTSVSIQYWEEGTDTDANGDPIWNTMCTVTVAPFNCSWVTTDTAKYNDGSTYDLRAIATLSNGTKAESDVIEGVLIDNTAPVIDLFSPGAQPLKGTVILTADAYDGESGIPTVKFWVSPAGLDLWQDICTLSQPDNYANPTIYSCEWDTTLFVPAELGTVKYDIKATTVDYAGNGASETISNQSVNNSGSSLSVVNPGSYIKGTVTIETRPFVPSPATVTSVKIQYVTGAGSWTDICTAVASPWSCSWNTTAVLDGLYELRAIMVDSRNLTTTSESISTNVDNAALYGANVQASNGHYKYDKRKNLTTAAAGKIDGVDTLTLTYSKAVTPGSIISGWNGSTRSIFIRILDGQFVNMATSTSAKIKDVMDFCTSWDSTAKKGMQCSGVGTNTNPNLGKGTGLGYVALNSDFVDGWNGTASKRVAAVLYGQITLSGNVVTIKIGSPCPLSAPGTTSCITTNAKATGSPKDSKTPRPSATMVWMPSAAVVDSQAGSACSTRPGPETGSLDRDF